MDDAARIEERLKALPASPGVYIMKGRGGEVIYIGKAKSLKERVRSYFRKPTDSRYATAFLASRTRDIDFIVTSNEKEALLLEDTLLKRHKPKYNIRLKDSKTYVSIKVTVDEEFPRIYVTRNVKRDGARYFGPYVSAHQVRETVKFLRRIFPLCVCSPSVFRNRARPCLDFQLGLCAAPAVGLISAPAYRELVNGALMFLEGRNTEVMRALKERMKRASDCLYFEEAARLRDKMAAVKEMLESQAAVSHRGVDADVFAVERGEGLVAVQALNVRGGRLVNSSPYFCEDAGLDDSEITSAFITEYYRGERYVPDEALVPRKFDDMELIADWLKEKAGRRVLLAAPARGERLKLVRLAAVNAAESLKKRIAEAAGPARALDELKRRLHLKNLPRRIEAFDISNTGGTNAVGAMVSFFEGEPDKANYRRFRIRLVEGPDDYSMMREVLARRYSGLKDGGGDLPDLILIDGGKGQLNVALDVLKGLDVAGPDVAALAKEDTDATGAPVGERVYMPNVKEAVFLREGSRPDLFLRRVRDEVHRFAVSYHRKLRKGATVRSMLDDVPGMGPARRRALFDLFNDLDGIRRASVEELAAAPGMTRGLAVMVKERLARPDGQ